MGVGSLYGTPGEENLAKIQVRTFNLPNICRMRALDPSHIEHLVAIKVRELSICNLHPAVIIRLGTLWLLGNGS